MGNKSSRNRNQKHNRNSRRRTYYHNGSTFNNRFNDFLQYFYSKEREHTSDLCFGLTLEIDRIQDDRSERYILPLEAKPQHVFLNVKSYLFEKVYEVNDVELVQIIQLWLDYFPTKNIQFEYNKKTLDPIKSIFINHPFSLITGKYQPLIAAIIDYDELRCFNSYHKYQIKELDGELFLSINIWDFIHSGKIAYSLTEKMSKYIIKHQKYLSLSHLTVRELYSIIFLDLLPCPIKIEYLCWYEKLACVITNGLEKQDRLTSWNKFLTRGIYDPRLFLLIFAFAN